MPACENGPSSSRKRLMSGATSPRSDSTGVISSDSAPSRVIVGRSSRRNVGSRSKFASRSARRSAVASATALMFSIDEETRSRSRASGAMIVSPSTARLSRSSFCFASIRSSSPTSLSAGLARRITSLRSSPRPARPMPSSLTMIERRWRYGSCSVLLSRSRSTERSVFSTGSSRWPSPGPSSITRSSPGASSPTARCCVGSHSTNFSPISDCGRTMHFASARKSW